eukprot:EG_transcript_33582
MAEPSPVPPGHLRLGGDDAPGVAVTAESRHKVQRCLQVLLTSALTAPPQAPLLVGPSFRRRRPTSPVKQEAHDPVPAGALKGILLGLGEVQLPPLEEAVAPLVQYTADDPWLQLGLAETRRRWQRSLSGGGRPQPTPAAPPAPSPAVTEGVASPFLGAGAGGSLQGPVFRKTKGPVGRETAPLR